MIAEIETQAPKQTTETVTLTLKIPSDLAQRIHALPADTINRFALAALPSMVDAAEAEPTGIDIDLIAELRAGDDEAKRVGTVSLEEIAARMEADDGPGMVERARARIAAYKVSPEHTLFEADKARHKAALEAEYGAQATV